MSVLVTPANSKTVVRPFVCICRLLLLIWDHQQFPLVLGMCTWSPFPFPLLMLAVQWNMKVWYSLVIVFGDARGLTTYLCVVRDSFITCLVSMQSTSQILVTIKPTMVGSRSFRSCGCYLKVPDGCEWVRFPYTACWGIRVLCFIDKLCSTCCNMRHIQEYTVFVACLK